MARWRATATWLAAATALWPVGCGQKADVVATIRPASVEPIGGSAGAGTGGGGSAGAPSAGRGGSGGSGGSAGISSGNAGGTGGGIDGGLDGEPPVPAAGSSAMGMGGSAGTAQPPCPLAGFYPEVLAFTESDCLLRPDMSFGLVTLIIGLRPVPPMGETRMKAQCEIENTGREWVYDEKNPNVVVGVRLCINLCDDARNSLVRMREAYPCLEEAFPPPDAGTGS
ncbi:MAG TPA: hypothetical protein VK509_08650 [Polyangiales bacterium]|nr:hypothetical protein [Polyangiales bacterium]